MIDPKYSLSTFCKRHLYSAYQLDKKADDYIDDIFGTNGYNVINNVEKLPKVFMSITA